MLQECVEIFQKKLDECGDNFILDDYIPADGTYVIVGKQGEVIANEEIQYDKKARTVVQKGEYFTQICFYDYYSKLVSMNKPVDSKKIIHSNNYLSFFIKKDSLQNGKLTEAIITSYYDVLSHLEQKYAQNGGVEIYRELVEEIGEVDLEKLDFCKQWIQSHIFQLESLEIDTTGKGYLKIYFEAEHQQYLNESKRYLLPNIFNSNDYNVVVKDCIMGLPNDNLSMNAKKPFLSIKTRKVAASYLVTTDAALVQKKFFDYLSNLAKLGKCNVYFNLKYNQIEPYRNAEMPLEVVEGYFLRIQQGKELEIHSQDTIPHYSNQLSKPFQFKDFVCSGYEKKENLTMKYQTYSKRSEVQALLNEVLFSRYLVNNYFTKPEDMDIKEGYLKYGIMTGREAIFNWAYKGVNQGLESILNQISLHLIKGSLENGYNVKAVGQFNLRWSLIQYFGEGEEAMADKFQCVRKQLQNKILGTENCVIESDEEYYYAVGQLASYFLSLTKTKNRKQSLINPFMNAKSDKLLKTRLKQCYTKYNYDIVENNSRFNHLYGMILSYEPESEVNQDLIVLGYISDNLIYFKEGN